MLRLFKSNSPLIDFIYLITGVLFWLYALLFPFSYPFYPGENGGILFAFIGKITSYYALLQVVLSLVLMLFVAVLLQQIKISYALIKARTKLVSAIFIVMVGGLVPLHTLHPVYLAAVFFLVAIYTLFSVFNSSEPLPSVFNTGFFLALATLFYLNLLVMLPAFIISLSVLRRERRGHEYFVLLLGFVVPWLFAFSYAFFADRLNEIINIFSDVATTNINHFKNNYILLGYLGLLGLLTIIGSVKMVQLYDLSKVSIRKYYLVLFIIFLFSVASFILPSTSQEMLVITLIPVSFLIANLLVSIESGELLFTLLFASAVFMQFANRFIL